MRFRSFGDSTAAVRKLFDLIGALSRTVSRQNTLAKY